MAEKQKGAPQENAPNETEELTNEDLAAAQKVGEAALGGVDELLDEIDDVLEENAEEFVKSYVQKGGQ